MCLKTKRKKEESVGSFWKGVPTCLLHAWLCFCFVCCLAGCCLGSLTLIRLRLLLLLLRCDYPAMIWNMADWFCYIIIIFILYNSIHTYINILNVFTSPIIIYSISNTCTYYYLPTCPALSQAQIDIHFRYHLVGCFLLVGTGSKQARG